MRKSIDKFAGGIIFLSVLYSKNYIKVFANFYLTVTVAEDLIKSLNGQIILIKGNHDRFLHNAGAKNALAGVKDYEDISITLEDGTVRRCILSHYFMPFYIGHRNNAIHLHGHSHNTEEHFHELEIAELLRQKGYTPRIVNVGCMHWNYEPVTLDEILAKYPM